jgi:hypothetical protein
MSAIPYRGNYSVRSHALLVEHVPPHVVEQPDESLQCLTRCKACNGGPDSRRENMPPMRLRIDRHKKAAQRNGTQSAEHACHGAELGRENRSQGELRCFWARRSTRAPAGSQAVAQRRMKPQRGLARTQSPVAPGAHPCERGVASQGARWVSERGGGTRGHEGAHRAKMWTPVGYLPPLRTRYAPLLVAACAPLGLLAPHLLLLYLLLTLGSTAVAHCRAVNSRLSETFSKRCPLPRFFWGKPNGAISFTFWRRDQTRLRLITREHARRPRDSRQGLGHAGQNVARAAPHRRWCALHPQQRGRGRGARASCPADHPGAAVLRRGKRGRGRTPTEPRRPPRTARSAQEQC